MALRAHGLRAPPDDQADLARSGTTATGATTGAAQGERVHTTANHPWLTTDRGWVPAGDLHSGESIVREGGATPATVVSLRVVSGAADYYNLTVSVLHTYAVGDGQYVVHNSGPECNLKPYKDGGQRDGHHILAKAAFKGNSNYDPDSALVIKNATMRNLGIDHGLVTQAQHALFNDLADDVASGVRQNTLQEHALIAFQSLIEGNASPELAADLVDQAWGYDREWSDVSYQHTLERLPLEMISARRGPTYQKGLVILEVVMLLYLKHVTLDPCLSIHVFTTEAWSSAT